MPTTTFSMQVFHYVYSVVEFVLFVEGIKTKYERQYKGYSY